MITYSYFLLHVHENESLLIRQFRSAILETGSSMTKDGWSVWVADAAHGLMATIYATRVNLIKEFQESHSRMNNG